MKEVNASVEVFVFYRGVCRSFQRNFIWNTLNHALGDNTEDEWGVELSNTMHYDRLQYAKERNLFKYRFGYS